MVYKKYIKIKGKKYGPYYYESYRVNGKIRKKYIGDKNDYSLWLKKNPLKKSAVKISDPYDLPIKPFLFLFLVFGIFLFSYFLIFDNNFSGKFENSYSDSLGDTYNFSSYDEGSLGTSGPISEELSEDISEDIVESTPEEDISGPSDSELSSSEIVNSEEDISYSIEEDIQTSLSYVEDIKTSTEEIDYELDVNESYDDLEEDLYENSNETNNSNEMINQSLEEDLIQNNLSEDNNSNEINPDYFDEENNFSEDITDAPIPYEEISNETSNETVYEEVNLSINGNFSSELKRYNIVINRPVKWVHKIIMNNNTNLSDINITIPNSAEGVSIKLEEEAKGSVDDVDNYNNDLLSMDKDELKSTNLSLSSLSSGDSFILRLFNKIKDFGLKITGNVVLEEWEISEAISEGQDESIVNLGEVVELKGEVENVLEDKGDVEIALEYYTEAPISNEEITDYGKRIIISSSDGLNYTDILAYTDINNSVSMGDIYSLSLYWVINDSKLFFEYMNNNSVSEIVSDEIIEEDLYLNDSEEYKNESIIIDDLNDSSDIVNDSFESDYNNSVSEEYKNESIIIDDLNDSSDIVNESIIIDESNESEIIEDNMPDESQIEEDNSDDLESGEEISEDFIDDEQSAENEISEEEQTVEDVSSNEESLDESELPSLSVFSKFISFFKNLFKINIGTSIVGKVLEPFEEENLSSIENDYINENETIGLYPEIEMNESLENYGGYSSLYNYSDEYFVEVEFIPYDLDMDGNVDYIEWIVPHLSEQVYELVLTRGSVFSDVETSAVDGNYAHLKMTTEGGSYRYMIAPGQNDKYIDTEIDFSGLPNKSISVWIKPNKFYGRRTILAESPYGSYEIASGLYTLGSDLMEGNYKVEFVQGLNYSYSDINVRQYIYVESDSLDKNKWNHIVGTFDISNGISLYVNGKLMMNDSSLDRGNDGYNYDLSFLYLSPYNNATLYNEDLSNYVDDDTLKFFDSGTSGYSGGIDDAMVYNRSLSAEEVRSLYEYDRGYRDDVDIPQDNLLGWWDFEEGSGSSITNKVDGNVSTFTGSSEYMGWSDEFYVGDRIVAYYPFDGDDIISYDYSDNELDGYYDGEVFLVSGAENCKEGYGSCANFQNGFIDISRKNLLNSLDSFTYSMWVMIEPGTLNDQTLISNGNNYHLIKLRYNPETAKYDLVFSSDSNPSIDFSCNIGFGSVTWRNLIITGEYSDNDLVLNVYLDKDLKCSQNFNSISLSDNPSYNLTLGGKEGLGDFKGSIDDLMIFNDTLSQKEIDMIFDEKVNRYRTEGIQYLKQFNILPGEESVGFDINGTLVPTGSSLDLNMYEWREDNAYNFIDLGEDPFLNISGSSSYLELNPSLNVDIGDSIGFWIRVNKFDCESGTDPNFCSITSSKDTYQRGFYDYYSVLGNSAVDYYNYIYLIKADGYNEYLRFEESGDPGEKSVSYNSFPSFEGEWHFYSLVFDPLATYSYKDGTLLGVTQPISTSFSFNQIGLNRNSRVLLGSLDEIMVFDKLLEEEEVDTLYGLGRTPPNNYLQNLDIKNQFSFDKSINDDIGGITSTIRGSYVSRVSEYDNLVSYYSADNTLVDMASSVPVVFSNPKYSSGVFGEAFYINGTDSVYISDTSERLGFSDKDFSISLWFNSFERDRNQTILSKSYNKDIYNYRLSINENNNLVISYSGVRLMSPIIENDVWNNVLLVYNYTQKSLNLYYNGELVNSSIFVQTPSSNTRRVTIGSDYINSIYEDIFNGSIDEIMFFNRSLSGIEARELSVKGRALWSKNNDFVEYSGSNFFDISQDSTNILPVVKMKGGEDNFFSPLIDISGSGEPSKFTVTDVLPPRLEFVSPTPLYSEKIGRTNIVVNVSSSDANDYFVFNDFDNKTYFWLNGRMTSNIGVDALGKKNASIGSGIEIIEGKFDLAFNISSGEYITIEGYDLGRAQSFWIKKQGEEWKHVVNNSGTIYVDGALASEVVPFSILGSDLKIGNINAQLDEIIVFNRTLSINEILSLYDANINQYSSLFDNLENKEYNLLVYAQDIYSNINYINLGFLINTQYPQINFVAPTSGEYDKDDVDVNVSVSDSSQSFSFMEMDNSLVAWWDMDNLAYDSKGKLVLLDYTGRNNCNVSKTAEPIVSGKYGKAMSFIDSSVSNFYCGNDLSLRIKDNITISFWFNQKDFDQAPWAWHPVSRYSGYSSGDKTYYRTNYLLYLYGDNYGESSNQGLFYAVTSDPQDNLQGYQGVYLRQENKWYHVVWTYSSTSYPSTRCYIDGELNMTRNSEHYLLYDGPSGSVMLQGHKTIMDEIMIFNRSLSADEVKALYGGFNNNLEYSKSGLNHGDSFSYEVFAKNSAGNLNSSGEKTVTIDKAPPTLSIISPLSTQDYRETIDVNVTVTDDFYEANGSCYYSLDNNITWIEMNQTMNPVPTFSTYSSKIKFNYDDVLAHRIHTLNISCSDSAGNIVYKNTTFNVDLFDLVFGINNPSQANTTNIISVSGQINRTNGTSIWPLSDNMYRVKLGSNIISSGIIYGDNSGNLFDISKSESSLLLNLSLESPRIVNVENYNVEPTIGINNLISSSNVGFVGSKVFDLLMSNGYGNLTYSYFSPTKFKNFIINISSESPISGTLGGSTCLQTSTDNLNWVQSGCLNSVGSIQYSLTPNSNKFYVRINAFKDSSGNSIPITQYKIDYSNYEYANEGYYDSEVISLNGARFNDLKWNQNINSGSVKIQVREKEKNKIVNSTIYSVFESDGTNIIANSPIIPPLPLSLDLSSYDYYFKSGDKYYKIKKSSGTKQIILDSGLTGITVGDSFEIVNESWNAWSQDYVNSYGSSIFDYVDEDTMQYRLKLSRGTNPYLSPNVSQISLGYINSRTDNQGVFTSNIEIPVSTNLGSNLLNIEIFESPFGVIGSQSKPITIYANSYLTYSSSINFSGDKSNYSVYAYSNRTDNNQPAYGNIYARLYDSNGNSISTKNCISTKCIFNWIVGTDIDFGNYTINLSTENGASQTAYYKNAIPISYRAYLEEVNTTGSLDAKDFLIEDYYWGRENSYLTNISINNIGKGSMYNISASINNPDSRIVKHKQMNKCDLVYPGNSCNITLNVTLSGSAVGQIPITWKANWTNNNGKISKGNCIDVAINNGECVYDSSFFEIQSNAILESNATNINSNVQHESKGVFNIRLTSSGLDEIKNVVIGVDEGSISDWISLSTTFIPIMQTNEYRDLQVNISVPPQTSPGVYYGNVSIDSNSKDGKIILRFMINVPINSSWSISPNNFSYSRTFGLNSEREIGIINITNLGNVPLTFGGLYYTKQGEIWINIQIDNPNFMDYNKNMIEFIANPNSIFVDKGEEKSIYLYSNPLGDSYYDVGVRALFSNLSAVPSSIAFEDNFSIVELGPQIDDVLYYLDDISVNNPELARPFKLKVLTSDDNNLDSIYINITRGENIFYNGSMDVEEYRFVEGKYRAINYSKYLIFNDEGQYNLTVTINDSAGNIETRNISIIPSSITDLDLVLKSENNVYVEGIDKYNERVVPVLFGINNSGDSNAYNPAFVVSIPDSRITSKYESFNNISSKESLNKFLNFNVSKLTPPGEYLIRNSLKWTNPNMQTAFSEQIDFKLIVSETKSLECVYSLFSEMDSSYEEVILEVNNSGNVILRDINIECLGSDENPSFCDIFDVKFSNSGFDIPVNSNFSTKVKLSASNNLDQGEYYGRIRLSNEYVEKEIVLIVSIPEIWSWTSIPSEIDYVKGVGQQGFLESVNITNTGNQDITFSILSSNISVVIPAVSSITIPPYSARNFTVNFNTPVEKLYKENLTISSLGANPPTKVIPVTITATNIKVGIVSPTLEDVEDDVVFGDLIEIETNATYNDLEIIENSIWDIIIGNGKCKNVSYIYEDNWKINCSVPNIQDGKCHDLTALVDYNDGQYGIISGVSKSSVCYRDLTSPYFINVKRNNLDRFENISLDISVMDNVAVALVKAEIFYPNGTNSTCYMSKKDDRWICDDIVMDLPGEYVVNYTAYDSILNKVTTSDWFEVYEEYHWGIILTDYLNNSVTNVTLGLYRPGDNFILTNVSMNATGGANIKVNTRYYDLKLGFLNGDSVIARNVDFTNQSDPLFINAYEIEGGNFPGIISLNKPLKGIAVDSERLSENNISVDFNYSEYITIPSGRLNIVKCSNWSYFDRACYSGWSDINYSFDVDKKIISANSVGFSIYFLSENSCGDSACDPGYGETLETCAIDCTVGSSGEGSSGGSSGGGGGGGGGGSSGISKSDIESLLKTMLNIGGVKLETTSIYKELFEGEVATVRITLSNTLDSANNIKLSVDGATKPFIFFEDSEIKLEKDEKRDVLIKIVIPEETAPGTYDGDLILTSGKESGRMPTTIRILSPEGKLLDVKIQPLNSKVAPGENIKIQTDLINLGKSDKVDVQFDLQLINVDTGEILNRAEEAFAIETSVSTVKELMIPEGTEPAKYMIKATAYYSNVEQDMQASSIAYIEVRIPFSERRLFNIPLWSYILVLFFGGIGIGTYYYMQWNNFRNKRFKIKVDLKKLPKKGPNSAYVGKVAEVGDNAYVDMELLKTHTLIAGATGSGKTVAAQGLIEEALIHKKSVIIFDPTAQWTGFLRKNQDSNMLKRYKYYGLNKKDSRGFSGNIKTIHDPYELIDIKKYMNRPGEITIINLVHLTPSQIDLVVASSIEQIFMSSPSEERELKNLFVYDEVHRLLPKFGGSGKGFIQIERAAREFRKWGMGLLLISQVVSDFVGEIKANIGTEVQLRTRYEGDLERVNMKYGDSILKSIVKAPVGTGMVVSSEYNEGRPYFISFRPLLHSTQRLSSEELDKYEKYFEEIEDIDHQISELKKLEVDVMGLELELKLVKSKVSEGQFSMVEMYFESLRPKLIEEWKRINKKPVHLEKKFISKTEILKGIEKAKKDRAKYIKKNPQEKVSLKEEYLKIKSKLDDKKKKGKDTSNLEIRLQDLKNQTKRFMDSPVDVEESGWILKEIGDINKDIEEL